MENDSLGRLTTEQQKLVEDYLYLVDITMKKYHVTDTSDYWDAGVLGLCSAAIKWDAEKYHTGEFKWFAVRYIRGYLNHYFKKTNLIRDNTELLHDDQKDSDDDKRGCYIDERVNVNEDVCEKIKLDRFLSLLSPDNQTLAKMLLDGYSLDEMGKTIGTSRQAVASRMRNWKRQFISAYGAPSCTIQA